MGFDAVLRDLGRMRFVIETLAEAGYALDRLDDVEPVRRRYSASTLGQLLAAAPNDDRPCRVLIGRSKWGDMNIRACRPTDPEAGSVNVVSVQLWHHDRANAVALLEASRTLLSAGLLAYSYAGTPDEVSRQRTQGTLHERLPGVFWTNVYGKRYVETIGLERLRSIAWSSIEVSDAGVVAQLYEDPAQPPADLHAMVDEAKSAVGREFFGARWLGGDLASFLEPKHAEHHQALPRLARS